MVITAESIVSLIGALVPLVAAIASIVTVYLSRTIHTLVNGAMTQLREDLKVANERITTLQAWVTVLTPKADVPPIPEALLVPPPPIKPQVPGTVLASVTTVAAK